MTGQPQQRQKGTVLAVGLVFLLIMTIIGAASIRSTSLDELMAGNLRNHNIAFQAAEAALREGENLRFAQLQAAISATTPDPDDDGDWSTQQIYSGTLVNIPDDADASSTSKPVYVVELINDSSCSQIDDVEVCGGIYRVTARGRGATSEAITVLQSIFGRYNPE